MITVALVIITPMAANTDIVVGRATTWPDDLLALAAAEAREVRHVQGERGPEADHGGQGRHEDGEELGERVQLAGLVEERPQAVGLADGPHEQHRRHHEHERRGPVLHLPQQVHAAVDDEDVDPPEEQEREPLRRWCGRRSPRPAAVGQPGRIVLKKTLQRLAADPGLDAEPSAGHERAHERGQVRADRPVGGAREHGEGMPYFVPGCELSRIGMSTIVLPSRIVMRACHQFMPVAMRPDASM
jgi:hypothetical protein